MLCFVIFSGLDSEGGYTLLGMMKVGEDVWRVLRLFLVLAVVKVRCVTGCVVSRTAHDERGLCSCSA